MGKSGSFFFFSHDKKLLIKTMTKGDFTSWNNLFREYFDHVCENPESLIAKVYGVYQVQVEGVEPQYLILMGSTAFYNPINCKKMYDLKGSLVERLQKGDEKSFKRTQAIKDLNLLRLKKEENFLRFYDDDAKKIVQQIREDVKIFKNYRLMDYSLLLVVEYNPNYITENPDKFKELGPEQKDQDLKKIQKNKLSKNVSDDQIDNFLACMSGLAEGEIEEIRQNKSDFDKIGQYFNKGMVKEPSNEVNYNLLVKGA